MRQWGSYIIYIISILAIVSVNMNACKKKGFSNLEEEKYVSGNAATQKLKIIDYFPKDEKIVLTSNTPTTFGIITNIKDNNYVTYSFIMDELELQTGHTSILEINDDNNINPGSHILTAQASNKVSTVSHTFNIIKNIPPQITQKTPQESSLQVSCKDNLVKFYIVAIDEDGNNDDLIFEWLEDDEPAGSNFVIGTTKNTTQAFYQVSCQQLGIHTVGIKITDPYESTTFRWTLKVINPDDTAIQPVQILTHIPTEEPVFITNTGNETFAVTVNSDAGSDLTFKYKLNGVLLETSNNPYYILEGSSLSSGSHILTVEVSNPISSDTYNYNVIKNTPPEVTSTNPSQADNNINCSEGSLTFSVEATDANNHPLTFTWLFNGAQASSLFDINTVDNTSTATFTPTCAQEGSGIITVEISDGYDTTIYYWSVNIINANVVQILSTNPDPNVENPVIILSTSQRTFAVNAIGKPPLAYTWKLNNTTIPGENGSILNLSASEVPIGNHTLEVIVSDNSSADSATFNIKRNAPPNIYNINPSTSTVKVNYSNILTFSINAEDENNDNIEYTWLLNNNSSSYINTSSIPNGSQAIFSPDSSLIGEHTIKVIVSDGIESSSYTWTVQVNYINNYCNNLTSGKICTIVGLTTGLGSNLNPQDNNNKINITPYWVTDDGEGNLFISDRTFHVIWFVNRSDNNLNRIGINIPAHTAKIIAGTGALGLGINGQPSLDFPLDAPLAMSYDKINNILYVTEYNSNWGRVIRFNSSGIGEIIFGRGNNAAYNSPAGHTEGDVGTNHSCVQAAGIVYDENTNELFVACTYTPSSIPPAIKKIVNPNSTNLSNILGYTVIGQHVNGVPQAGSADGTAGATGTARTHFPFGLSLDSEGNLYFTELKHRVRVWNRTSNAKTYFNTITVNPNEVKTLFGVFNTTGGVEGTISNIRLYNPISVIPWEDTGTLKGLVVSNQNTNRIIFVNNTSSTLSMGGTTIPSYEARRIIGTGSRGFNGDGRSGISTLLNYPAGTWIIDNQVIFSDYYNNRIRKLNIGIADDLVSTLLGSGYTLYSPNVTTQTAAEETKLYYPTYIKIVGQNLYYSDRSNYRIRKMNLITGEIIPYAGGGSGVPAENVAPSLTSLGGPTGLTYFNNILFFADNRGSFGSNRHCLIRGINTSNSNVVIANQTIYSNSVLTLGGNYYTGCVYWNTSYEGANAVNAGLALPEGIAVNSNYIFISNYYSHCILKIDNNTGLINTHIGKCGTAGDVTGIVNGNERLRYPKGIILDPNYLEDGNMFIVDQTDLNTNKIKYVNFSTSTIKINGINISPNYITTIYSLPDRYYNDLAIKDNQLCISGGALNNGTLGAHHVICKDINAEYDTTTLLIGAPNGSTIKAYGNIGENLQENISASSARLYEPYGIDFDSEGNLYIVERSAHRIRMVKKWWE